MKLLKKLLENYTIPGLTSTTIGGGVGILTISKGFPSTVVALDKMAKFSSKFL